MPASPVNADRISSKQARRIALAAQGFAPTARRGIRHDRRHLGAVFDRIGLIQIDSVNVLVRSHYLPLFSRLGPWRRDLLHDLAYGRRSQRRLFEYWGHEASLLPVETQPLLRWRMARAERHQGVWGGVSDFARERPEEVEAVFAEVAARGPIGVSDLELEERRTGPWWGWHGGKLALEWLFWAGRVTTAGRRGFERLYDLPERVLPPTVLDQPTPAEDEAQRGLIRIAAAALGIATERDLRDYFRLDAADGKVRVAELVEAGALMPVAVEGWQQPAYLHPEAAIPSRVTARALLSPFDSLVWERQRTERLFGFR
ncbi:MAG: winged helix-turn-helix domain-containing protein, partial [Inquilinus sp.]|nr:winged helix-turn-helix domain-containing protein [Inquilinus sp.]